MHLAFDIFQGIGIAAAVGIRPFLPAAAAGGLAAGDVQINFTGTDYSFLEAAAFLLAMVIAGGVLLVLERRFGLDRLERGPALWAVGLAAAVLGALFFAGSLAQNHYAVWPGYVGGVICGAIAILATRPLFARARARLDAATAGALPLYAEAAAVLFAVLSVVAPPVGLIGLALLVWLLLAGRRREGQKYAGLRILR